MSLNDFIVKFEKLRGRNEFDPEVYSLADGLYGEVKLRNVQGNPDNRYNCVFLTVRGKLKVECFSKGICVTANESPDTKMLTHFKFVTEERAGVYNILRDYDRKRTVYSFSIENEKSAAMSIDIIVEDNKAGTS